MSDYLAPDDLDIDKTYRVTYPVCDGGTMTIVGRLVQKPICMGGLWFVFDVQVDGEDDWMDWLHYDDLQGATITRV